MRITISQLRRIIKEEVSKVASPGPMRDQLGGSQDALAGAIKAYARKPSAATLDAASDAMIAYFLMIDEDGDLLRDEVDAIASRMNMDMDVERFLLAATEDVISL